MQASFSEKWIVVINHGKYVLNEDQAHLLKGEIAGGNRGIVMFKDFAISIPYIQEFYLDEKVIKSDHQLPEMVPVEDDAETIAKRRKFIADLKKKAEKIKRI